MGVVGITFMWKTLSSVTEHSFVQMETLPPPENLRCTLCKTNETSKWHFSLDDNILYCIMCYYQTKSRGKIRESDVFEVINNSEVRLAEEKHERDMYEMINL